MLQITSPTTPCKNSQSRLLARLRRMAKARGFRIRKDWSGVWSLVDARIEPPRALVGLFHVSLPKIEAALLTPLPPPRVRKPKPVVEASHPTGNGAPQPASFVDDLFTHLRSAS
jgi:hypothetical protein